MHTKYPTLCLILAACLQTTAMAQSAAGTGGSS